MKKVFVWVLAFAWTLQTVPLPVWGQTGGTPKRKEYVAILDFEVEGEIMKGLHRAVADKVREALLSTRKYIIVDRGNIRIIMDELAFGQTGHCDESCAVEVGRALSAHLIITGRITRLGPNECQVSGQMTDVERTDVVRSASESCSCEATDIIAAAETIGLALAGVEAKRGTLVINATPKTSIVYVDGAKKGNTPVSVKVKPGRHKIMVAARGYAMQERQITVAPGATMPMNFRLKEEKKKWYQTWWFYTIVGVAVAGGVAAGVSGGSGGGGGGTPTGDVTVEAPVY